LLARVFAKPKAIDAEHIARYGRIQGWAQ
jgi:hypothetical protein